MMFALGCFVGFMAGVVAVCVVAMVRDDDDRREWDGTNY